jgi:hypothetical protein
MQRYTIYLYLETALHVSGGTSTHHQERIQLYLQHLVFVSPLLLSAAIVEELELVWVCCGWRTHNVGHAGFLLLSQRRYSRRKEQSGMTTNQSSSSSSSSSSFPSICTSFRLPSFPKSGRVTVFHFCKLTQDTMTNFEWTCVIEPLFHAWINFQFICLFNLFVA